MENEYISEAFDTVKVSSEKVMSRVNEGLADHRKIRRVSRLRVAGAVCVAVAIICITGWNIPSVNSFAQNVLQSWGFTLSGSGVETTQEGNYISLPTTKQSKTEAKYDTISEIEDMLGVDILESPEAYVGTDGLIDYDPGVKDGALYSATIMNDIYSLGDLKNVQISADKNDYSLVPDISYDFGEKYRSSMRFEITVRGVRPDGTEGTEYEQFDDTEELPDGMELTKYTPAHIGKEVAIITYETDDSSGMDDGSKILGMEPMTIAQFVYNDISYIYLSRVSVETMQDFLDTLTLNS